MENVKQEIVMGRKPVLELLASGAHVEKIWLLQGMRGEFEIELRNTLKAHNIPVQHVPDKKLNHLVKNANHQGVIAFRSLVEYQDIEQIIAKAYEDGESPLIVILDGVTDVRNLGAIARSAEIFGAHAILTPLNNSAIINEISFKISAGALAHIAVCREKSLVNTVKLLQNLGLTIFAANHHAEKTLEEVNLSVPCGIVFGDEGEGVSHAIDKLVNESFTIPQSGNTESLNVSVAAGVILYKARR